MQYPYEKFIFKSDIYDLPCDAWSQADPLDGGDEWIRFISCEVRCGDCKNRDPQPPPDYWSDDVHPCPKVKFNDEFGKYLQYAKDDIACFAFSPIEE